MCVQPQLDLRELEDMNKVNTLVELRPGIHLFSEHLRTQSDQRWKEVCARGIYKIKVCTGSI